MNFLWDKVTEWLKELLIGSIMSNLTGLFDNVNRQVTGIADNVGATPQAWNGGVFGMIRNLSDNVILPIAGVILALVATLELIQMIVDRNNMHDMDTFMLAKWVFKTACAVVIVTNTWNIVMAVFDVAQSVVSRASGLVMPIRISASTASSSGLKRSWRRWSWARCSDYGCRACLSALRCGRWQFAFSSSPMDA